RSQCLCMLRRCRDVTKFMRIRLQIRQFKSEGLQLVWGYPEYFFGREPAAAGDLPKTQTVRKKKRLP
ncbi:MAG: hypothetical protein ACKPJD_13650, partial [Planctomycetaceae bacterium]